MSDIKRVFVYWNLHRNLWSIVDLSINRVIAHTDQLSLTDCSFVVRKAGRERVIREGQKNVHAGVRGFVDTSKMNRNLSGGFLVTYNPYKFSTFVKKETEEAIFSAKSVQMNSNRSVFAEI